jgi:hypothetical protein
VEILEEMMIWVVKATYEGDEVEFSLPTEKDDLKVALAEARKEACRIFELTGIEHRKDEPRVFVKKHPAVL